MVSKILVAVDKSALGDYVFEKALSLASELNASLILLHVLSADEEGSPQAPISSADMYPYPMLDNAGLEAYGKLWKAYEQEGLDFLKAHTEKAIAAGLQVNSTQTSGSPGRVICDLARSKAVDLIVVGRRGRTGLSEFLLGSVSNYVVHHAPCEVLIVHTPKKS
jgi:nucleotide-binding universal stress UspA family protein